VIAFAFDPVIHLGDATVKLETLGIAASVLVGLLLAGWLAAGTPSPAASPTPTPTERDVILEDVGRLRIDDMIFIVLGILPGAVIGGRLGYVLIHLDFYRAHPAAIVDPGQGSLELTLAIVGGALSGAYACYLLGESVGRWFHVATIPTFAAVTLGKVAQALGGSGQGQPIDLAWATSYQGDGPWGSLAPAVPAHPSQLYEAAATFVILVLMARLIRGDAFARRDGRAFVMTLVLWLIGRALVATTWRDPTLAGPLVAEQLICLFVALASLLLLAGVVLRARRRARAEAEPAWPDPETRPHF